MDLVEKDALPLPDDLDQPEDSPYLRRKKSVPVRRSRVSRRVRIALFIVAVLVPVGFVGYALATFALTSSVFVLASPEDVAVIGNHYVAREEVLGALGVPLTGDVKTGTNIFRISLDVARRGVETLPWVRTASVTRILPHGLRVNITERTPIAYSNVGGRVGLVDEDGMLLDKPDNGVFDFPVIYGLDAIPAMADRRQRLALYTDFMRQLAAEAPRAGWMISEVYLNDPEDLRVLLINGQQTVQVHFGRKDFLQRFQNFIALLPDIQKSSGKLDSIDLRYHNQIVVDPQTPAPAAGAAGAAGVERKD